MKIKLPQFAGKKLIAGALRFAHWIAKISGGEPAHPNNQAGPSGNQPTLPPFSGGPDEAALLASLPPAHLVKEHRVVPINEAGEIPESLEQIKLTQSGKAVARTDFLAMDGNGVIAPANQQPKGHCQSCLRFVFEGNTCAICGQFICQGCTAMIEDANGALKLCNNCERIWRSKKLNW